MKNLYKSNVVMLDYLTEERTNVQKYYFLFKIVFHQNIIYVKGQLANSLASFNGFSSFVLQHSKCF